MTRSHTRKGPNVTRRSFLQLLGGGPAGLVSGYEHGSKIHPQYEEEFENGVAVAWQNMPFMQGGWAIYSQETRDQYYEQLFEPDGRVYLAGEHMSYLTGTSPAPHRLAGRRRPGRLATDAGASRTCSTRERIAISHTLDRPEINVCSHSPFPAAGMGLPLQRPMMLPDSSRATKHPT